MCQRYLAHTAEDNAALAPAEQCASSSSGSLVPGDGRAAGLASEPATADGSAAQLQAPYQQQVLYKDLLHQADSQRAALQQEVAALQVQLQGVRTEVQEMSQHLDQLQGRGSALARCSVSQLQQLEALLESSARSVRAAMLQRTIEEQRKASADSHMCSACHQAPRCMVLGCGHQTCSKCGESAQACPLCSAPVATRIWLSG
jgi:chromosome segregation ATPase